MAQSFRMRVVTMRFAAFIVGLVVSLGAKSFAQTTSLQFVHLSADPALSPVTVWAGVPVFGMTQFIPAAQNIAFRNATPAISAVPNPFIAGAQIPVSLFIDSALTANITAVSNTTATPTIPGGQFTGLRLRRGANISFVRGVQDAAMFAANPSGTSTRLSISTLVDTASVSPTSVRILFYNAATDAPGIDVIIRETNDLLAAQVGYDQAVAYNIPDGNYTFDVYQGNPRRLIASYSAPLRTLGYTGQRVVIAATGFLNPAQNRNGAAFGLTAIPNTEIIAQVFSFRTTDPPSAGNALPAVSLQAIHASADPTLNPLALWLNTSVFGGTQFAPLGTNIAFRTATPARTSLASGTTTIPLQGNTNRPTEALITAATSGTAPGAGFIRVPGYLFTQGGNLTLMEGVTDTTRFARNPSGRSIRFQLRTLPDTATFVAGNQTRFLLAHSATDLGDILFDLRDASGTMLATYGPFSYGQTFLATTIPAVNYSLVMRLNNSNTPLGTFALNLASENLGGRRVLVTATGFATPAQNLGGPGVRLLAAVNDSTGRFFLLPGGFTSVREQLQLSNSGVGMTLHTVSPNPVREAATVRYDLSEAKEIELSLINAQGTEIWREERRFMPSGAHSLPIDASTIPQGAYMLRLSDAKGNSVAVRFVVVK
ncbi:MAG: T9SS type A sorting domain-containing protein [Candidatus Kapabacteria bacterium]|nr:T9SS type A sorting domain-containing protein [Candidatus Kapabacteria bacterium]